MTNNKKIETPAFLKAINTLPEELHDEFTLLVEDYKFSTQIQYAHVYVAPMVLADLIKAGWRRSGKDIS